MQTEFINWKLANHPKKLLSCNHYVVSPELHKCYFLYIHKQIHSKVPILLNFVDPKRPSGNCYVSFPLLTSVLVVFKMNGIYRLCTFLVQYLQFFSKACYFGFSNIFFVTIKAKVQELFTLSAFKSRRLFFLGHLVTL